MKRLTKAALGGIASGALILGATQAAIGELPVSRQIFPGPLVDLNSATTLDSAEAVLKVTETRDGTYFSLRVKGIAAEAGDEFGAHLHVDGCVAGIGSASGDHYNTDVVATGVPYLDAVKTPTTEVWLDLVVDEYGVAVDQTLVPFVPVDTNGKMSIVLHQDANNSVGVAGPREACLPLDVPSWMP